MVLENKIDYLIRLWYGIKGGQRYEIMVWESMLGYFIGLWHWKISRVTLSDDDMGK